MRRPAWIGLGSNLGDSKKILQQAWQMLGEQPQISLVALSSPWRTAPVAMESDNWFINAVGKLETELSPEQLLQLLLQTEAEFGRIRSATATGYQDRTLDLDLLYFGEDAAERRTADSLQLPHSEISQRLFVLLPLQEIEPELQDPVTKQSVAGMIDLLQHTAAAKEQRLEIDYWLTDIPLRSR